MKKDHKISGFKTPDEYFDKFDAALFIRLEEEKFPKYTGFQIPTGYFDNLEETIIKEEFASHKQSKLISLFPKRYYSYAAAIAASLILGVAIFNLSQDTVAEDSIQISLIDKYIEEGYLNMDLLEFATYLESENLPVVDLGNDYISQSTLRDYLLENTEDEILMNEHMQ